MTDVTGRGTTTAGTLLGGKYRVEGVLGEGGMGRVVAATHLELGTLVAIKFLLPQALENPGVVARFEREARATASLQSDHAVKVLDVGRFDDGSPYMVMEYLQGCDLSQGLENAEGPLPISECITYILQAALGLADAHDAGVVHRDIKPSNIFLQTRKDGRVVVKVLDFGIAKSGVTQDANLTQASSVIGSPKYMSPEQLREARHVDARTDIWSLGVTLFELLTGGPPFASDSMAVLHSEILNGNPPLLRSVRPEAPMALEQILSRCLEKVPANRFESMRQLHAALTQINMGSSAVTPSFAIPSGSDTTISEPRGPSVFDATAVAGTEDSAQVTGAATSQTGVSPTLATALKSRVPWVAAAAAFVAAVALGAVLTRSTDSPAPAVVAAPIPASKAAPVVPPSTPTPVVEAVPGAQIGETVAAQATAAIGAVADAVAPKPSDGVDAAVNKARATSTASPPAARAVRAIGAVQASPAAVAPVVPPVQKRKSALEMSFD